MCFIMHNQILSKSTANKKILDECSDTGILLEQIQDQEGKIKIPAWPLEIPPFL